MKKAWSISFLLSPMYAAQPYYWEVLDRAQLEVQLHEDLEKPYDESRDFPLLTYVQSPYLLEKVLQLKIEKSNPVHQALTKRALRHAVMMDYCDSANVLLKFGVPATARSGDPINYVRSESMVDLLVAYGAQVNRTYGQSTPLFWALDGRHISAIRALVKHGASLQSILNGSRGMSAYTWLSGEKIKAAQSGNSAEIVCLEEIEKIISLSENHK